MKDKFILLKDLPNTLDVSSNIIENYLVENGDSKYFTILKLFESRIKHFTKDKIYSIVKDPNKKKLFEIVNIPTYLLPVTYNTKTNKIIINLIAMGSKDISRIDQKNIYASIVYGICFSELVKGNIKVNKSYYEPISNFLLSLLIKLFGKEYGLLGIYSIEIKKLHFLIASYVLKSFFEVDDESYINKKAFSLSSFNYKSIENELLKFDLSKIEDFILSLDQLRIMPGMNKYHFSSRALNLFGFSFLPALEDLFRFISIIVTSSLSSSTIVPSFISKYNETEYNRILEIGKNIF